MPHESIDAETGPKGTRCVVRMSWTGRSPYVRPRTWRSQWFNSGNEQRDFYLARLHARISNIRKDALHQLTTNLTRRFHTIGIEDLNVRGMVKNRHLSRAVSDMGFFEFGRQLGYKAAQRGGVVVVADRWYPSSKTCSDCGHKLEVLSLAVRQWVCPACGVIHNRDVNAAINLRNLAVSSIASACGEEGAGSGRKTGTKPASVKQESSSEKLPMGSFA